ncbi:MAG: 2-oxoacid:acceptor oxidoreductase subunit alpha [Deltaproteobacteria bacterium]|nr:2-oxoacid:acceptor oxidoreductase subunit alpha [Deltaproteobacteria bacterium]
MSTENTAKILMGNYAAAHGALAAGCSFYAGYPITPSSEIMEMLAERLPDEGGAFIQMEDEIASISALIGASWTGAKVMTATSGPGLSLMMEGLGYAAMTETPLVLVDVQRAGPATGQATRIGSGDIMQARYGSHGDYFPIALSPWSVQEMYDLTIRAFNLAERYRVPVLLLADEGVGHLRESVMLHRDFELVERLRDASKPPFGSDDPAGVPPMPAFGDGANLMVTGSTHDAWGYRRVDHPDIHAGLVDRLCRKISDHADDIVETESHFLDDAELALVAYGFTGRSAIAAVKELRRQGHKVGLLRLRTLWPFPEAAVAELGGRVKRLVVPELNRGQVAGLVRQFSDADVVALGQTNGEPIEPKTIVEKVLEVLP